MDDPIQKHYDPTQMEITLRWEDQAPRECYVRGAICWPRETRTPDGDEDYQGYALLAIQDVDSKIITIVRERPFTVIDNIMKPGTNVIDHEGLSGWLTDIWGAYYAHRFFWYDNDEIARQYTIQIMRSGSINPKPELIKVPWPSDEEAEANVLKHIRMKDLVMERHGEWDLFKQIKTSRTYDKDVFPAVHALQALLMGYDRFPYRRRNVH